MLTIYFQIRNPNVLSTIYVVINTTQTYIYDKYQICETKEINEYIQFKKSKIIICRNIVINVKLKIKN